MHSKQLGRDCARAFDFNDFGMLDESLHAHLGNSSGLSSTGDRAPRGNMRHANDHHHDHHQHHHDRSYFRLGSCALHPLQFALGGAMSLNLPDYVIDEALSCLGIDDLAHVQCCCRHFKSFRSGKLVEETQLTLEIGTKVQDLVNFGHFSERGNILFDSRTRFQVYSPIRPGFEHFSLLWESRSFWGKRRWFEIKWHDGDGKVSSIQETMENTCDQTRRKVERHKVTCTYRSSVLS